MPREHKDPDEKIRERNIRLIIKAGIEIFSRKGYDGTRIAEIAEASGLPKANVYYYFSSKEQIYTAIIEHLLEGWDNALKYITADREPAEAFRLYIRAKLDYTRKNVAESRLFASEIIQGARFLKKKDRQHVRDVTDRHVAVVEAWIAEGKILPVDPRHLFIMLWASTQFYADFEPIAADGLKKPRLKVEDYEMAAKTIAETVLRGVLPQG
ncbi:TetR family transcriptional regulator C-terminal domain-containing protein [Rhizobium lusitanum]|uniref:AcrR family transcriptional regulator n=1 Tax=Rhizobium lusitanum TaxID=293958 RepID=A0A7X0J0T4_9HYPH|nr:TetR family transcriptional regulator C-terminal domain-containing protein [Rhizobium lusitanum]MBB6489286.1 AcrR family transcriptional regulator [Rhizobium lusitanum]